jgi:predicted ATPase/DNA-binding SARP family transcriptional activator
VRVHITGDMSVEDGDRVVGSGSLAGRQGRLALAYLTLEAGRAVPRDELAEALWPLGPPTSWQKSLTAVMSRLRRSLEAMRDDGTVALRGERGCYQLVLPSDTWVDVSAAEALVESSRAHVEAGRLSSAAADATVAAALARRPLLPGDDAPWLDAQRARLREVLATALDCVVEAGLGTTDAVRAAQEAVALDPLRERAHIAVMRALAATGERAKALRAYEECRLLLVEELGASPSPETEAVFLRILAGEPFGTAPSTPATTAVAVARRKPFIGRDAETDALVAAVEGNRLVTITGTGGAGKTALAIHVSRVIGARLADGERFVDLSAASDAESVARRLASDLGVRVGPGQDPLAAVGAAIAPQELLVVLDNCEQALAGVRAVVAGLLRAAPHVRILGTSREAIAVDDEVVRRIPPLTADEAVELFVFLSAAARPGFELTESNAADVGEVCRRLDGLPLAIELAAARIQALTPREIAERLNQRFVLLSDAARVPRHQTLQAVVAWSYELLDEEAARLLRRLSVFEDGFTLEAAEAICGDASASIAGPLTDLLAASLLGRVEQNETSRYAMLETIKEYAAERLADEGEVEEIGRRHAEWFADRVETWQEVTDDGAWHGALGDDLGNYRAALAFSAAHGMTLAPVRLCAGIGRLWHARGLHAEALEEIEAALRDATPSDQTHPSWPRLLVGASSLCFDLARLDRAAELAEQALAAARVAEDARTEATALQNLGTVAFARGEWDGSDALQREALEVGRRAGNGFVTARSLLMLGMNSLRAGDNDAAAVHLEEALALFRAAGGALGTAQALLWLGDLCRLDDFERARAQFEEALEAARRFGSSVIAHTALVALAGLLTEHGYLAEAKQHCVEGLASSRRVGDRMNQAHFLERLGGVFGAEGDGERAARLLAAAAKALEDLGLARTNNAVFEQRVELARVAVGDRGRFEQAWTSGSRLALDEAVREALEPA